MSMCARLCVRVGDSVLSLTNLPVVTLIRYIFVLFPLFESTASSVCGVCVRFNRCFV